MTNSALGQSSSYSAKTQLLQVAGRLLAYRCVGSGPPLLLCLRFRGVLDAWDPYFLDSLAETFRVITFDYSGFGQSTGVPSYEAAALARDALDIADALNLQRFAVAGWSIGGQAAQALAVMHPDRVSELILLGTTPPGSVPFGPEPVFYQRALKFENDLDDEIVLFFEPASERSRSAAKASHDRIAARAGDRSPEIPESLYRPLLARKSAGGPDLFPDRGNFQTFLAAGTIPILVISGDHDIVFPVGNWHKLSRSWQSLHILTIPQAGHAPHHQEPRFCADVISSFITSSRRPMP